MRKTKLIFTKENLIEKVKEIEKKHKGLACQIEIKLMGENLHSIERYGDLNKRAIKVVPIYKGATNPCIKSDLKKLGGKYESITRLDFLVHARDDLNYRDYHVREEGIFLDKKYGGGKVASIIYETLK